MQKTTTIRKATAKVKTFINFDGKLKSPKTRQVKITKGDHMYKFPQIERGVRALKVGEYFTMPHTEDGQTHRNCYNAGKRHNMELTVRNCPDNRAHVMVMRLS